MKLSAKVNVNPTAASNAAAAQYRKDLRAAAIIATDRAIREASTGIQQRIVETGLGRLSRAVGNYSTKQARGRQTGDPYGVIFAKGGDNSQSGGALESYSRGAVIRPGPGTSWLAIPTKAVPKFISIGGARRRLTPDLYMKSGLMTSIGALEFRPLSDSRAIWVIKRVSVSPKTGRAKAQGTRKTRTRVLQREIIAFVGIRVTRRAQKFNKDGVVAFYSSRVPTYIGDALTEIQRSRGG